LIGEGGAEGNGKRIEVGTASDSDLTTCSRGWPVECLASWSLEGLAVLPAVS